MVHVFLVRAWFVVSIISLLVACASPPEDERVTEMGQVEDAIVKGRAAHDAAVVALHIDDDGLCTGALIAPRLVLTARHCVSFTAERVACPSRIAQLRGNRDPQSIRVSLGATASGSIVARGTALVVPRTSTLCEKDIAVLVLDRAVAGVTPLALARNPPRVGDAIRFVGFGKRGDDSGFGQKRARTVVVEDVDSAELAVGEVTCSGDSGGPALDEDGNIVGVVSRGGSSCEGDTMNIATRADVWRSLVTRASALVADQS